MRLTRPDHSWKKCVKKHSQPILQLLRCQVRWLIPQIDEGPNTQGNCTLIRIKWRLVKLSHFFMHNSTVSFIVYFISRYPRINMLCCIKVHVVLVFMQTSLFLVQGEDLCSLWAKGLCLVASSWVWFCICLWYTGSLLLHDSKKHSNIMNLYLYAKLVIFWWAQLNSLLLGASWRSVFALHGWRWFILV